MAVESNLLDLLTPAQAAEELGVNVTTLRKYSLLIEKVTGDDSFFARKNNKRRNYTQKNIANLKQMIELSQRDDMTLELAAESLFDGQVPDQDVAEVVTEGMSASEKKLNEKISKQAKEIKHLRKQLKDSQQENYALIRALKNTQETPLFDYDMQINEEMVEQPKQETKFSPSAIEKKEKEDKYAEALARARKISEQKKQKEQAVVDDIPEEIKPTENLRTLSSMQISENTKKKWWQR